MSKNPRECFSCKRPTTTLAVESRLVPWYDAEEDVNVSPLEIYHPSFSVFKFCIIKKGEGSVYANLHPNDIPYIRKADTFAYQQYMEQKINPLPAASERKGDGDKSSPIFSEFIPVLEGTIGSCLLCNGENGVARLREVYNQLSPVQKKQVNQAVAWFHHGELEERLRSSIDLTSAPAYTMKLRMGTHKGKTPAEILSSDQHGAEILKKHEAILAENVRKFPQNQSIIDAIHNAFELHSQGYLLPPKEGQNSVEKRDSFELVNSVKVDKYRTNENGLAMVRSLRIYYEFAMNSSPITIAIENCYARSIEQKGKITFDSSTRQNVQSFLFRCTLAEWESALSMIERQMSMFETMLAAEAFRMANDMELQSREDYKNSTGSNAPRHRQSQPQTRARKADVQSQSSFKAEDVIRRLLDTGDAEVSRLRAQYKHMPPETQSAMHNIVDLYINSNSALLPNQQTPFELLAQTRNVAALNSYFKNAGRTSKNGELVAAISSAVKLGKMARFS